MHQDLEVECQLRSVAWRDSARRGSRPAAAPATPRTCRTTRGTWPGGPAPGLAPPSPGRRKATLPTRPLLLRTWPVAEDTARGATCVTAVMSPAAAVRCYQAGAGGAGEAGPGGGPQQVVHQLHPRPRPQHLYLQRRQAARARGGPQLAHTGRRGGDLAQGELCVGI